MKLKGAYIYLLISSLIWGATVSIMKLTLREVPLFTLCFIRMFLAAVIIFPFVAKIIKIQKPDFKNLFLASVFATNLNLTFGFTGLKLSTAINASLITASIPIFTLLAAYIFLKEKITSKLIGANIIAFLGVVFIVGSPILELNLKSTLGNIFLMLASASWIIYEIISKKTLKKYSALLVTFYIMAIGTVIFLPFSTIELINNSAWIYHLTISAVLGIAFGIIFSSVLAYYFWQKGLSLLPTDEASFFFYVNPLSGIFFAIILLGEKLTLPLIFGGVLIVIGVFVAESHRKSHILHREQL